jgi:hypothetical protein
LAPEPVSVTLRGEKSCPYRDLKSNLSAVQPIASCYRRLHYPEIAFTPNNHIQNYTKYGSVLSEHLKKIYTFYWTRCILLVNNLNEIQNDFSTYDSLGCGNVMPNNHRLYTWAMFSQRFVLRGSDDIFH